MLRIYKDMGRVYGNPGANNTREALLSLSEQGHRRDLKCKNVAAITEGWPSIEDNCGALAGKEAGEIHTISFAFQPPISRWCFSFVETNQKPEGKGTYLPERRMEEWRGHPEGPAEATSTGLRSQAGRLGD